MLFRIVVLLFLIAPAMATIGFDGIQSISKSTFECLARNGHRFFIARVWQSIGNFDTTGIANIKNAKAAGWKYVDGYIFPCLKSRCAPPANQVEATVNRLRADKANFGMLWLDIERQEWPADKNHNRQVIRQMAAKLDSMKVNWGIYTNNNNWQEIVGLDFAEFKSKPLWWANYNFKPSFAGFVPFGGWQKPAIHQYQGTTAGPCGVSMDLNWYP